MSDYTKTGQPIQNSRGISKRVRDEFTLVETAVASKADIDSPSFVNVPVAPTAASGTNTTQLATTAFVFAAGLSSSIPVTGGDAGKLLTNDGATPGWDSKIDASVVRIADGSNDTKQLAFDVSGISSSTTRTVTMPNSSTTMVGTGVTQTLTNKTLTNPVINVSDNDFTLEDNSTPSKKAVFQLSGISSSTTRTITLPDENVTLGTPVWQLLSTVTASDDATVDIEWTDGAYDSYIIIGTNIAPVTTTNLNAYFRFKQGGSYITTSTYVSQRTYSAIGSSETAGNSVSAQPQAYLTGASWAIGAVSPTPAGNFYAEIHRPDIDQDQIVYCRTSHPSNTGTVPARATSWMTESAGGVLTGIRFFFSAGNVDTGTFAIYGIRNS